MSDERRTILDRLLGRNQFKVQHAKTGFYKAPIVQATSPDLDVDAVMPGMQGWQELVLKYADKVPIASAGARFYEESTKRVRFYLAVEETGDAVGQPNLADPVIDILNRDIEEISRAVGMRFLIGESRHTFDRATFEFTTRGAGELEYKNGSYILHDYKGKKHDLPDQLDVWRSYDPDRKWSELATSSHRAMLDIMEAFVIAYAEERAVSIRLAMNTGIVGVSEDIFAVGGDEDATNSEGSGPGAAMEARFHEMLQMTIKNPRDSANFVPPVLVTPSGIKVSDAIQHVPFAADRDKRKIAERIDMLKEEYAVGVDLPADVAKGFLADMNHWNGQIVSESSWSDYLAPKIQSTVVDAFEEIAYALGINVEGLTVGLDNSQLVSPTDMSETAARAYELGAISSVAYRKYAGFTEEDAPGEDEVTPAEATPAPNEEGGDNEVPDEEVEDDQGEGVIAAATEGPNLKKFNRELRAARYTFELELRNALRAAVPELVPEDEAESTTAAADPNAPDPLERVAANIARIVRRGQEGMALAAARGLATRRAQEWAARHADRLALQAERAGADGAKLVKGWLTSRQAKAIPGRDLYGIARSIESVAAGGPQSMYSTGNPTQARPKAIMEDSDFLEMVAEEGSASPQYQWEHGSPPMPFAPHAELEGTTWEADEEREVLDNPDPFPASAIYHPGDHDGCTCRYDVEFVRN